MAEQKWDTRGRVLIRYLNDDGTDFDEFRYAGMQAPGPYDAVAATARYLNALEAERDRLRAKAELADRLARMVVVKYTGTHSRLANGGDFDTYSVDELMEIIKTWVIDYAALEDRGWGEQGAGNG